MLLAMIKVSLLFFRLLVGAPNTTDENIRGYGDVIKCENPNTEKMACSSLHIRQISDGKSMCGKCPL